MNAGDGEMILVIDDNETNLKLVATVLAADGFDVCTATDAASALAAVREHRPLLAYTDVQLPDMDGLELARHLKTDPETAHIVVVALTACAMEADRRRAFAAGCDGFIAKPFDTRTLGDETTAYLNRRETSEARQ
jgi:two-component system, cell cycle response regulator DivK